MSVDVAEIEAFYRRPDGLVVAQLLRQDLQRLETIWTNLKAASALATQQEAVAVGFPFALLAQEALPAVLMRARNAETEPSRSSMAARSSVILRGSLILSSSSTTARASLGEMRTTTNNRRRRKN